MNPGLSFEQTILGPGPKCYIPKFMKIGPLFPEKKMFNVFTIYGSGGHVVHVTDIILGHRELIICPIFSNGESLVFDSLFCISGYM